MTKTIWRKHILPFAVLVGLLGVGTVLGDYVLHRLDLVWIGRYLGIPGTLLIIGSLVYSLRKRKMIRSGNPKALLSMHEFSAWLGSLLVLIHAGVHFNAILPWLATVAMGINTISGLVGKLLLGRSREHVQSQREHFQLRGLSRSEVDQAVFWDAVMLDAMTRWRKVHIPIFVAFAVLGLGHIISIFLFWGWI
ncbi:MAG: hypothetical protein ROZ37_14285 [Aromatoleum sp.]|jgi:hypothetical protein|uniref:hypothetical protein n=1 Tax=Aromatoleum sp. TaxID=2307007 RepID=UPI002895D1D5|nr:hypothetical protein [Aromatoleum sp.]MDT3671485.1 hypothetical protein [Aromatoleum sp.]